MHCQKSVLFNNFIRECSAIKYVLTNAAQICDCWKNGRYFYKTYLATIGGSRGQQTLGLKKPYSQQNSSESIMIEAANQWASVAIVKVFLGQFITQLTEEWSLRNCWPTITSARRFGHNAEIGRRESLTETFKIGFDSVFPRCHANGRLASCHM